MSLWLPIRLNLANNGLPAGSESHCTSLEHRGISFQSLNIAAPAAQLIRLAGITRDPRLVLQQATQTALGMELQTPLGWVLLN